MLRIIAGKFGGRRIQAPSGYRTRPTSEKVRGALFNMLEQWIDLDGATVVDLYAGSGALGIESLSRGAAHATFVDADSRTCGLIRENLKSLNIPSSETEVACQKAIPWLKRADSASLVQLVLLDPPYAAGEYDAVLTALGSWPCLAGDAILAVECSAKRDLDVPASLEVLKTKRYGDTELVFLRKSDSARNLEPPRPVPNGGAP